MAEQTDHKLVPVLDAKTDAKTETIPHGMLGFRVCFFLTPFCKSAWYGGFLLEADKLSFFRNHLTLETLSLKCLLSVRVRPRPHCLLLIMAFSPFVTVTFCAHYGSLRGSH